MLSRYSRGAKLNLRADDVPSFVQRFMHKPIRESLQFDLPSGNIFVRLGVMDLVSGRMGTLEIPETVAK